MPMKAKPIVPAAAPSPWDVLFGTAFTTDYELRGVSQSNHHAAAQGYFELDYTATDWLKFYAGVWGSSLWTGFADAEFDLTAGARFSWGNFGLDLGYVYYYYPDGLNGSGLAYGSFGEFYAKPSYKVADWLTIGGVFERLATTSTTSFGDRLASNDGAYYYSGNAVITLPWHPVPTSRSRSILRSAAKFWRNCNSAAPATPTGTLASTSTTRPSRSICVTGIPTHLRPPFVSPANAVRLRAAQSLRLDALLPL